MTDLRDPGEIMIGDITLLVAIKSHELSMYEMGGEPLVVPGADLHKANLRQAELRGANMQGARR